VDQVSVALLVGARRYLLRPLSSNVIRMSSDSCIPSKSSLLGHLSISEMARLQRSNGVLLSGTLCASKVINESTIQLSFLRSNLRRNQHNRVAYIPNQHPYHLLGNYASEHNIPRTNSISDCFFTVLTSTLCSCASSSSSSSSSSTR